MTEWAPAVARFRYGAAVVGGGALLAGGRVLTCAHVVNAALGRPSGMRERPREPVTVDFPLQGVDGTQATVVAWSPLIDLGQGDVALIELADDRAAHLAPLVLVDRAVTPDEELAIFGFPPGRPAGVWKRQVAHAGALVGGWGQLIDRGTHDYKLQAGFSGCPVLDAAGYVVGIFTQAELAPDVNAGAEIPAEIAVAAVQASAQITLPLAKPGQIEDREFAKKVATDTAYYTAKLGTWPVQPVNGEEVIAPLQATLQEVEGNPGYRQRYRNIWATLYRMIGGAYLIHSKLEMGDKLRAALPYLRQSHDLWPDQQGLAANVNLLETFLRDSGGDVREYLTAVLQILRGPGDTQIPMLVDEMAVAASNPESTAQSWLLNQATPTPIWNFLEAVQLMMKKERNIDADIEVNTQLLPNGHVEVQATIGPNVFLWEVDSEQKKFEPRNEFTHAFMRLIENANTP
jgi:hypothetical protein